MFKDSRCEGEMWFQELEVFNKQAKINMKQLRLVERGDRQLTVRMIASQQAMQMLSAWKIITENLGICIVFASILQRLLNEDQKKRPVQLCQNIIECLQTEAELLGRVITGDKW